jgi:thymidylate synthase (FAD)
MKIELLAITQDAEKLIESAGRTAYKSEKRITDDSAATFIAMLVRRGHTSVLEHASATFRISGVSRAFSHQLVRHRIASYTQKSQRYVSEKEFNYVIPESIKNDGRALESFLNCMELIASSYEYLQALGIKNEDARFVLPNACETEIVITANFRVWRHIIELRVDKAAQWEIRDVCMEILKVLKEKAPSCFGDL